MTSVGTVVVTNRIHPDVLAMLRERFHTVVNVDETPWPQVQVEAHCRDAEALLAFMTDTVSDDFLAACPRLKIVAGALKGWDNFDVEALTRRGVWLTVVPDLLTEPTAELAVGLMIGLARNVKTGDAIIRDKRFDGWRPWLFGDSLNGAEVGIVGMGAVGQAIAKRLAGFSVKLSYYDPQPLTDQIETALQCRRADLDTLVATNTFVVLAAPLTPETFHMIDDRQLSRFRQGSYLVNVSRGSLVCEAAIGNALRSNKLAGYAADVFEFEDWGLERRPTGIDSELLNMPDRTLFTPHLGSAVKSVRRAIEIEAALSIIDVAEGRAPRGAVNHLTAV